MSIPARTERWAAGTGDTLTHLGFPLLPGALRRGQLHRVAVHMNGTELRVALREDGYHPDGSVAVLGIQSRQNLTGPVTGTVTLDTTPTAARLEWTEPAWLVNTGEGTTWQQQGMPAGVIVPSDPDYLCAALRMIGPLVSQAKHPVIAGCAAVDAARERAYQSIVLTEIGYPNAGAGYNDELSLLAEWAMTGSTRTLRTACSAYTKMRTAYLIPGSWQLPEWQNQWDVITAMELLLSDREAIEANRVRMVENQHFLSQYYDRFGGWSLTEFGARWKAKDLGALNSALTTLGPAYVSDGRTVAEYAALWLDRALQAPFWDGSVWTNAADRNFAPWQQAMMVRQIVRLCEQLPASPLTARALAACVASARYLAAHCVCASEAGTVQMFYYVTPGKWVMPAPLPNGAYTQGRNNVDLNGFLAVMLTWAGVHAGDAALTALGLRFYASVGLTPADGSTGPWLARPKQCAESFHALYQVPAYVARTAPQPVPTPPPPVVVVPPPVPAPTRPGLDTAPVGFAVLTSGTGYTGTRTERTVLRDAAGTLLGITTLASATRYSAHICDPGAWRTLPTTYRSRAAAETAVFINRATP